MSDSRFRGRPVSGPESPRWGLAFALRVTVAPMLRALFHVRVSGLENVPEGPAILAGNHVSYLDPVLLWCVTPRPVHFVAKSEIWNSRVLGWMAERVWAFPVNRGSADREMITTATGLLQAGDLLGMFPEGTRSHVPDSGELGQAHGGVSFIALRADVPIVPVRFSGTDKAWARGQKVPRLAKVRIRFLEPVHPNQFEGGRKERMEALTAEVMRRIAAAVDVPEEG
ncbi:MAG: 1-acyl-sn-glycerol-3-phosphate acyltransferase [Actinobacteria bacterium HGW-Actinobacteria-7]|nr:MAG: 1-acyl-sn-glycerol-3-phosphate acyltransferase [Actinobacteria bacterium HGW-Actinobacteria-7]